MNNKNEIKRGALVSYAAIIFNIIAGLIYTPWMIHQIGQSDYGLFILATSFITLFSTDFGLGLATTRFISKYKAQNNEEQIKKFLGLTYKLYFAVNILIFLILLVLYFFINNIFKGLSLQEIEKFKIIYTISGLFTIISFQFMPLRGILMAYEKFIFLKTTDLIQKILIIILMVIALYLGYKLYALVLINAFVGLILIGIRLIYMKKNINIKIDYSIRDKNLLSEVLKFSLLQTIVLIAQQFILNITPSILGITTNSSQIAVFSIGNTINGYIWSFAIALNGLFLPMISKLVYSGERCNIKEINKLMIKIGRIQLLVIGALFTIFYAMGSEFINLWIGDKFQHSYYVALFLILTPLISTTLDIANNYLIAINEIKYRTIAVIIVATISIVLSYILSLKYGAIGSAAGICLGNMTGNVVFMCFIYIKKAKLDMSGFFKECHLKMISPIILTIIIGFTIQHFFPTKFILFFAIKAIILGIVYITLMWIISLNSYEKNLFLSVLNKLKTKH